MGCDFTPLHRHAMGIPAMARRARCALCACVTTVSGDLYMKVTENYMLARSEVYAVICACASLR